MSDAISHSGYVNFSYSIYAKLIALEVTMKGHDDMGKGGCFSIFLGQQSDEEEMLDYLAGDFAYDFGFEINPADGPEYDASADPVGIAELLDGFSMFETYRDQAVELARSQGLSEAHSALVFFHLDYDRALINEDRAGDLEFLGTLCV